MWGGDVEPQRFVVELMDDGNILIPTEVAEDFKYITSHPDLVVEQWETVHPAIAPLVCADRVNA
jgi:hypothetical protein